MKKSLVISLLAVSIFNGYKAEAHTFKNEKLKDFYGSARVYLGYQIGMNEDAISNTQKVGNDSNTSTYTDFNGKEHRYDIYKKTNHALSIAAGYNLYYKGLSELVHPFIGLKAQVNIPLYYKNSEHGVGMLYKNLTGDRTKDHNSDNVTYKGQQEVYIFDVLEFSGKFGTKINLSKNVAIEPYVGIGKVLSVISNSSLNEQLDPTSFTGYRYVDSNNKITEDLTYNSRSTTIMSTSYAIGADVVFDIAKQTFTAGVEYKFVNYRDAGAVAQFTKHHLSFNFGYQFL